MLIECPACGARAKLPESKEGAKVRCGACDRVYVARAPGARNVRSGSRQGLMVGLLAGGLVLVVLAYWVYNRGETAVAAPPPVTEEVAESAPAPDTEGWNSPPVRAVRDFYDVVRAYDAGQLAQLLAPDEVWAQTTNASLTEGQPRVEALDFAGLNELERDQALDAVVQDLLEPDGGEDFARWKPVDGQVVDGDETHATVHLEVDLDDSAAPFESKTMAFRLELRSGEWKVAGWARYVSPEEALRARAARAKSYEKVELADGSVVFEAEPKPLGHLEDTPLELRERIDELYEKLIDLDLTTEATRAREELVEIGKPAIPVLLTGLYEIQLEDPDDAIRANNVVIALRDITGEYHGYEPMELAGSTTGTTRERRESSIKQWFAWWYRKGSRFEAAPEPEADPLEGLIELDEREKAQLERDRRPGG